MTVDPTRSTSFAAAVRANERATETADPAYWQPILDRATPLMDDDIRDSVRSGGPVNPLDFLVAYMARHHAAYGDHFEWG